MMKHNKLSRSSAYSVYGYNPSRLTLLGFNGERIDRSTGFYMLGNGYRAFSASLMRFNCPDSMSPFSAGGINAYAYCLGDPVNFQDPAGHSVRGFFAGLFRSARKAFGSASNILPAKQPTTVPEGYSLIGYHGGALENRNSLETGLSSKFSGSASGQALMGEGFYFASKFQVAAEYAGLAAAKGLTPHVYGVYAKERSFQSFRKGVDGNYARIGNAMMIDSSLFGEVVVREEVRMPIVRRSSFYMQEKKDKAMELWRQGKGPDPWGTT
ncbi:RHS repeat-associated core domain-containing protein [Pseudomonas sp. LM20]|uniref:RHS repeat-associated core domain-containing protein n=1 Tax=unclassified Pseudomonas TaxID=196821 RepID=UPI001A9EE572|nr:RHS repeat-associated core domain-containing protein [Pseudomonas sp. LM20]